ncbi:MAG: histidinol dehydrogenase, partial [Deltaproteobacteria bacterium]
MRIIKLPSRELEKILARFDYLEKRRIKERVARILTDVRLTGDAAVVKYTQRFDGVKLTARQLRVTEAEKSAAYQDIKPEFVTTLKRVFANITKFYSKQLARSWRKTGPDGVMLGEKIDPLERVGVYVPAGTAPLVSCVFMSVLPARVAGVQDIVLMTPPDKQGHINPHILVVADLLKVQEIYRVGGAQAIGAMAYGTKTVRRVDKIVGPGNNYVTEAKRQ